MFWLSSQIFWSRYTQKLPKNSNLFRSIRMSKGYSNLLSAIMGDFLGLRSYPHQVVEVHVLGLIVTTKIGLEIWFEIRLNDSSNDRIIPEINVSSAPRRSSSRSFGEAPFCFCCNDSLGDLLANFGELLFGVFVFWSNRVCSKRCINWSCCSLSTLQIDEKIISTKICACVSNIANHDITQNSGSVWHGC